MTSISELTPGRSGTLGERWLFYNATFILGVSVAPKGTLTSSDNIDNIFYGTYQGNANACGGHFPSNLPANCTFVLTHFSQGSTGWKVQILFSYNSTAYPSVFYRCSSSSGYPSNGQGWVRLDNFGCNTLAELKAALNALP